MDAFGLWRNLPQSHDRCGGHESRPYRPETNAYGLRPGWLSDVNDLCEISQPLLSAQGTAHINFNRGTNSEPASQAEASSSRAEILQRTEFLKCLAAPVEASNNGLPSHANAPRLPLVEAQGRRVRLRNGNFIWHLHYSYGSLSG